MSSTSGPRQYVKDIDRYAVDAAGGRRVRPGHQGEAGRSPRSMVRRGLTPPSSQRGYDGPRPDVRRRWRTRCSPAPPTCRCATAAAPSGTAVRRSAEPTLTRTAEPGRPPARTHRRRAPEPASVDRAPVTVPGRAAGPRRAQPLLPAGGDQADPGHQRRWRRCRPRRRSRFAAPDRAEERAAGGARDGFRQRFAARAVARLVRAVAHGVGHQPAGRAGPADERPAPAGGGVPVAAPRARPGDGPGGGRRARRAARRRRGRGGRPGAPSAWPQPGRRAGPPRSRRGSR